MKKTLLIATACIIAVIVAIIIIKTDAVSVNIQIKTSKDTVGKEDSSAVSGISFGINPRNSTYFFENGPVTLIDGYEEKEIVPGAASRQVTQYSGNEIKADLNNDQIEDAVFVLTQSQGGSGTFFYVAAALGSAQGYQGTNVILLGDRISPLAVTVENGAITVSYLERKPEEPMTGKPSISVSKQLRLENGKLVETADR
ncbi:MAG: hypothetical protein JNL03_01125 [Prolixibacteraceae bacterium]|nr:hypothetical protein [Prolixibacteraceae bacterium]